MISCARSCVALLLAATLVAAQETPAAPTPVVATHYFYWYRWPGEHFDPNDDPGREGHLHRLPAPEKVSYLDPAWHAAQLRAMKRAGIDVALPVYWGAPGAYERPNLRFSRDGLGPMVEATRRLGSDGVRIGMFYDTSTLLNDVRGAMPRGGRADLLTPAGRELFCRTVVEYFEQIPDTLWARMEGRALVVLYSSGFAARWDRTLGEHLRQAFAARFPKQGVFLVADASWGAVGQDRTTAWGAALWGPRLFPGVAQIGPGYDDSPVPGRSTPVREREDGAFYRHSWRAAVAHRPELVLIETWNEMHEGTEICETRETGTFYLDLTREWVQRLKSRGDPGPAIALRWSEPRLRPDLGWGAEAEAARGVSAVYGPEPARCGLRERACEDGPVSWSAGLLQSPGPPGIRYLYLQVSDHWRFDLPADDAPDLILEVETRIPATLHCEYDSHDREATLQGAYTAARRIEPRPQDPPERVRFRLRHCRLANRQNGGSDLRLVIRGEAVEFRSFRLDPAP